MAVGETSGTSLTLTATIHFDVGAAMKYNGATPAAGEVGEGKILLTQWGSSTAVEIDDTPANNTRLLTASKNGAQGDPNYRVLANNEIGWIYYPVRAWIEDTTSDGSEDRDDHLAVWKAGIDALGTTNNGASVKFTYDHTIDESSGVDTTLGANEVYMYGKTDAGAPTSYAKNKTTDQSAATLSTTGVSFSVAASALYTSYVDEEEPETDSHKLTIGYLVMRVEGSVRNHTHNTNYSATINSAAAVASVS